MAHLLTQPHQNYNSTTEQPSLRIVRNQAEQKSSNYGRNYKVTYGGGEEVEEAGPTPTCSG